MAKLARWTDDDLRPRKKGGALAELRSPRDRMYSLADDVTCFQLSLVNVYFLGTPGAGDREWLLVDTGLPTSADAIRKAAEELFGPTSRPAAIVLTHGHIDHVSSARTLADRWNAPIFAHELELPYLTGRSDYAPADPTVGGPVMGRFLALLPSKGCDLRPRVRALPEDGSVPELPAWRWLHTPGHSAGHVSLFRDLDRTLIAGDAFTTLDLDSALATLTQRGGVHGPPAPFTPDWPASERSVRELAALEPRAAGAGHGKPMAGDLLRRELARLAKDFGRLAVPERGRYVARPAVADERGVVSVPPPVVDPVPVIVAGVGLLAAAGLLLRSRSK